MRAPPPSLNPPYKPRSILSYPTDGDTSIPSPLISVSFQLFLRHPPLSSLFPLARSLFSDVRAAASKAGKQARPLLPPIAPTIPPSIQTSLTFTSVTSSLATYPPHKVANFPGFFSHKLLSFFFFQNHPYFLFLPVFSFKIAISF